MTRAHLYSSVFNNSLIDKYRQFLLIYISYNSVRMVKEIVIFGSTGLTGLSVTQAAVDKGLKVKAFLRDAGKLPESLRNSVEIVQGNVLDYDNVLAAVKGTDAVIVTLGTGQDLSPTTYMSDGLKNVIKAMKEANVEIVSVCLSAFLFFGVDSDRVPDRLKDITKDHVRMFDALKASDLKYIAVFPPHIADDPSTGYVVEHDKFISRRVSKVDLAKFLVDSLERSEHYGKIVGIGSQS